MKELEKEFIGIGEVKGFKFKQILANDFAYIYEVIHPDVIEPYYEVFERRINQQFDCVSYPKSGSFGLWAWCIANYGRAVKKFNDITERAKNKEILENEECVINNNY